MIIKKQRVTLSVKLLPLQITTIRNTSPGWFLGQLFIINEVGVGVVVVVVGRGVVTGHCQYQVVVPAAHIVSLVTHYVFKLIDF